MLKDQIISELKNIPKGKYSLHKASSLIAQKINKGSENVRTIMRRLVNEGKIEKEYFARVWASRTAISVLDDTPAKEVDFWESIKMAKELKEKYSSVSAGRNHETVFVDVNKPIVVMPISDIHIGSFGTDYEALEDLTKTILQDENLYVMLVGDLTQMSIKLRSVIEVGDNMLTPGMQFRVMEAWLDVIQHKVLCATWCNHAVMREENVIGWSPSGKELAKRFLYFNGIGHVNVVVGDQEYKMAVSHFFQGRSMLNPVHAQMRYGRMQGLDREIIIAGDSHVPGMMHYTDGPNLRLAINCGTLQTSSGYAQRFFSISTHDNFPCFVLRNDVHSFQGFFSYEQFKLSQINEKA